MIKLKEIMIDKKLNIFMMQDSIKECKDSKIDGIINLKNNQFRKAGDCIIKKSFFKIKEILMGT